MNIELNFNADPNKKETSKVRLKGNPAYPLPSDFVVIDIETTGLSPEFDDIIELGAIKYKNHKKVSQFQSLVNPKCEISDFIQDLTKITNEELKKAPVLKEVLPLYLDFIDDFDIVGHNIHFDINFIYDNAIELLGFYFQNDFIDTRTLARRNINLKNYKLSTIASFFDVDIHNHHNVISDCESTYEIFEKIINLENFSYHITKKSDKKREYIPPANFQALIEHIKKDDKDNFFYKKNCCFTGKLEKMLRKDAMKIIDLIGGSAKTGVTSNTDFLILDNNDYCGTIKDGKSSKLKKAEELKLKGQEIEIIPENVFYELIHIKD